MSTEKDEPHLVLCPVCGGTGIAPAHGPAEPGMLPAPEVPVTCPRCEGKGFVEPESM